MEPDTRNCWTLAEALSHSGPHRQQHYLARARVDMTWPANASLSG
ncbi:hypothetical protein [Streptomyces sp. NPDC004008]